MSMPPMHAPFKAHTYHYAGGEYYGNTKFGN